MSRFKRLAASIFPFYLTFAAALGAGLAEPSKFPPPQNEERVDTTDIGPESDTIRSFLEPSNARSDNSSSGALGDKANLWNSLESSALLAYPSPNYIDKLKYDIYLESIDWRNSMLNSTIGMEKPVTKLIASRREMSSRDDENILLGPVMFQPLTCNDMVDKVQCDTTFSSLIASSAARLPVTIPCGACVIVDQQAGQYLTLEFGLRVEGKLYFPPSASLTIRTTFVLVLGVLKMDVPAPGKYVKISLFGEDDIYFMPTAQNSAACSSPGCKIGKKVIAVAGGRLDILGYAAHCPAWEKLQDVRRSRRAFSNIANCTRNIVVNGDARNGTTSWTGYGRPINVEDGALRAYGRIIWWNGLFQTLPLHCFAEGQTWNIAAKVKLYNESNGAPLDCRPAFTGNHDCPLVILRAKYANGAEVPYEFPDHEMIWNKGGWSNFSTDMTIKSDLYKPGIAFIILHLAGGRAGSAILWDNIVMQRTFPIDQLKVTPTAAACWHQGTELVITSHTRWNSDEQVVTVASSDAATGLVTLTKPIIKPITQVDSPDFAVEVASLSRQIRFQADSSPGDTLIGGHLIIMYTRGVVQHIEGVDIRNFGQQGNLGRYPIHFHLCEAVPGSILKRNVVRESNQRCYVVHGSHGVKLEDNVAYNNSGHCYFLEDGGEQNNTFTHNIGIKTKPSTRLLSALSGRVETDYSPAVFWISNPLNYFSRNVAAGSDGLGYWFETHSSVGKVSAYQHRPDYNPSFENLGLFQGNEAHSCIFGPFTTYFPGWQPTDEARLDNVKMYRNIGMGMFLHQTRNLRFTGGKIADNGPEGVFIIAGDNITFDGTEIIGLTARSDGFKHCQDGILMRGLVVQATKLQDYDNTGTIMGLTLKNVSISRWTPDDTGCNHVVAVAIGVSPAYNTPLWSSPTSFTNVKIDGAFDACSAYNLSINDAAIEVTDGSVNGTRGFLVQPRMTTFAGRCKLYAECLYFCTGSCLRTIRFLTNSAGNAIIMVVTAKTGIQSKISGRLRYVYSSIGNSTYPFYDRQFGVSLPTGSYHVSFLDAAQNIVYPEYVIPIFEKAPSCSGYVTENNIFIFKPPITSRRCNQLIKNGGFDKGLAFWQSSSCFLLVRSGVLMTTNQSNPLSSVSQWIDSSCLKEGARYDLRLQYRLVDTTGKNVLACDAGGLYCPKASLSFGNFDPSTGSTVWTSSYDVGLTDYPYKKGLSFNTMTGTWIVTGLQAIASRINFAIYSGAGKYLIDNITMSLVDRCPAQLIMNGDASAGTRYWNGWGTQISLVQPGADGTGHALKAYGRANWWSGIYQNIDFGCIASGNIFLADFKVKLYADGTKAGIVCVPNNDSNNNCPHLRLRFLNDNGNSYLDVKSPSMVWNANSWNRFQAKVTMPATMAGSNLQLCQVILCGGPGNSTLLIDNFTFIKLA